MTILKSNVLAPAGDSYLPMLLKLKNYSRLTFPFLNLNKIEIHLQRPLVAKALLAVLMSDAPTTVQNLES